MPTSKSPNPAREPGLWEKNLLGVRVDQVPQLFPGLILALVLAWFSLWLGDLIGIGLLGFEKSPVSPVMLAILLGVFAATLVRLPSALSPGLTFTVKKVLRLGIIFLGIRLTVFDVIELGAFGVPIVILCILGALLITTRLNQGLKLPERLGALIAVGTSICGVTAIIAAAPAIDADEQETTYAVSVITIFGLLATLAFPYLANWLFQGDGLKAGLFLGTAVHDTSQVVGAAKVYADVFSQPAALEVATVTKLVRNTFMMLVIPYLAYKYSKNNPQAGQNRQSGRLTRFLPLFILGFVLMAVLRSVGDAGIKDGGNALGWFPAGEWTALIARITSWAENLLVVALAGMGLSTNLRMMQGLGIKPFLVGLGASLSVSVVSFFAILLLGNLVTF